MIEPLNLELDKDVPLVEVRTTHKRGFTADELSELCAKRIISVSENAPPVIRDQARAYQKQMEGLVADFMRQAIRSDRTTVYNALTEAGHPQLAELIRRL